MVKQAIITGHLGRTRDRFQEYQSERTMEEKLRLVSELDGVDGVEMVHPYEVSDPKALGRMLGDFGLTLAAVNVNIKAEPEFRNGSLSSPDAAVRAKAVDLVRRAKEFAAEAAAEKVTCCPLADGYEFAFQLDYGEAWKRVVECIGQANSHVPGVALFIEYKPSETRGRCLVDTGAKALCLVRRWG